MSKLNKLVTNYPVSLSEEEIENLSATLAPVVAACGGGGGGTGGKIYTGIGYVNVNNSTNQIGLTEAANTKLNQDIPTKVSDLSDSANYQTVAGMTNYLTTATYETDSATFLTKTSAAENLAPISVTADVETLKAASGDFSEYYKKTDTSSKSQLSAKFNQYAKQADLITTISIVNSKQDKLTFEYDSNDAISSINHSALAGQGGVTGDYYSASNPSGFITSGVSELDNFYSKTDTSSKTELQTKFDSLLDYNVTAAAGIEVTTATDVGIKTFGISMTAQPVVTDTRLSGYNGIAAEPDGNVSGLWDVGLTQDMLNTINGKLDSTVAAQTYQLKGDYVSSTDITDMATKTWVGNQGYLKNVPSEYVTDTELQTTLEDYATNTLVQNTSANITALIPSTAGLASETDLQIVSAGVDYVSAHAITAHQSLTNYYTKSETSGATELSTEFGKYALKSEIPTVPTKVSDLTDSANYYKTTETSSKNELSTEFAKYLTNTQYNTDSATFVTKPTSLVNKYLVLRTDNAGEVSGWADFNANVYSKSEADGRYQKKEDMGSYLTTAQYETDSATFYPTSNPDGYLTKTVADTYYQPTGSYATSAGLTVGNQYAMTTNGWAVVSTPTIPDITANNGLSANGHTIGIDNTNLVTDTQYAWTTTGWSDIGLSAYLPLSGGTVSGQLTVSGNGFNNNLHLKRDNNDGFIGLANNGAITFKNIVNGSTSQIEFLTSANKTFDITVKDNSSTPQPVGKLYVMSAHSLADATATSANWANDGMLHIILES